VAWYVDFAEPTGMNLTLSPTGSFNQIWNPYAACLRPLIDAGQVQIGNHTWSHPNLLKLGDTAIRTEIERNEDESRPPSVSPVDPGLDPPYGSHNSHTDDVAAGLGYTNVVLWNATLGDATLETPEQLLSEANKWIKAGAIVLGHANHTTVIHYSTSSKPSSPHGAYSPSPWTNVRHHLSHRPKINARNPVVATEAGLIRAGERPRPPITWS
jgi:peptidoglycan-N-acetylglucosamine deacetylase